MEGASPAGGGFDGGLDLTGALDRGEFAGEAVAIDDFLDAIIEFVLDLAGLFPGLLDEIGVPLLAGLGDLGLGRGDAHGEFLPGSR